MVTRKKRLSLAVLSVLLLTWRGCCYGDRNESQVDDDLVQGQERLLHEFLNKSNIKARSFPLTSLDEPVVVQFGFVVINIVEVNAKSQFIVVHGWVRQKWNNTLLTWNPDNYGGVDMISVRPSEVWVPDIYLYNNIDLQDRLAGGKSTYKTDVVLRYNGVNTWHSPSLFKIVCHIKVSYFPLDEQNCSLKFGSWTQNNRRLKMEPMRIKFPSQYYTQNGEWRVNKMSLCLREQQYQSSPNSKFDHVVLSMRMRRVANDYLINLIIPCCLISSMIFLGFILPPESGERIGLSITVLLAMTVFQQLTSEIMPSYDFPILGQYYFAIVLEISTSIVATTLILNFYHRTHRKMPYLLKKIILDWTSRFVFLHDEVTNIYRKNTSLSNEENRVRVNLDAKYDNKSNETNRTSFRKTSTRRGRLKEGCTGLELDHFDKYTDIHERYSNEQNADADATQALYGINVYPNYNMTIGGDGREVNTPRSDDSQDISEEESELRKCEWTLAARTLDRFVLFISIVIGVVTVSAVFLRAPALWSERRDLTIDDPIDIADHCQP